MKVCDAFSLLVFATMTGLELGVAAIISPLLAPLPAHVRAPFAAKLGRVMPFWYIASLVLMLLDAWVHRWNPQVTAAAVLLALVILMTVLFLVPLNNRIARQTSPATVRADGARWDILHQVRVALLIVAMLLLWSGQHL